MGRKCEKALEALFGIVGCLHLGDRRTRDANFYIVGDFQNDGVAVHTIDGAVDPGGRDDLVAVLDGAEHLLHLLTLPLLRQNDEKIHDAKHQHQGDQEATESGDPSTLPDENACQSHPRRFLPYPFLAVPHRIRGVPDTEHAAKQKTAASGNFPAYPARPILVLRVDLTRVATGPQENPASPALRIRLVPQHSGHATLMRNWIVVQKR